MKYKLCIWTGVLSDYTDGMAVAVAETVEEAQKLLVKMTNTDKSYFPLANCVIRDIKYEGKPFAEYVWGGG